MAFPSDPYPGQLHREGGQTWWWCPNWKDPLTQVSVGAWMIGYDHWWPEGKPPEENND